MPDNTPPILLDVTAAAAALGMTKDAVRKAIYRGTMRARAVAIAGGFAYRIDPAEVTRYATEHRTPRLADR